MTTVADVLAQMYSSGMPEVPDHLEVSGRIRRFGKKKRGWYRLNEHVGRRGKVYITGRFGYWGVIDGLRVVPSDQVDEVDLVQLRREIEERAAREEEIRARAAARAAMRSADRWRIADREGQSIYLRRKRIDQAESVRYEPDGMVLVPMIRYDLPRAAALVGIQAIAADGQKRFTMGTAKRGSACRLGLVVEADPIMVAEGYATGMTVRMALDRRYPVFVAFDAGNLQPVVEVVRALHPQCPIVICADDDWRSPGNPGKTKAWKTARAVANVHTVRPVWGKNPRGEKDTDFNDLHVGAGLDFVRQQFRQTLQWFSKGKVRAA